jgi:hypothetical protein
MKIMLQIYAAMQKNVPRMSDLLAYAPSSCVKV